MNSIMETVYVTNNGKMMGTIERYIFRETKNNNQINDKLTVKTNAIFDVIVHEDPLQRTHKPVTIRRHARNSAVRRRSLQLHR